MANSLTRDTMPPVPTGKIRLWGFENGPLPAGLAADIIPLETATAAVHSLPTATLAYETRGYVNAGSCMRWQEAQWSVTYWLHDGTRHGRRFLEDNEAGARAYFATLTDGAEVSKIRQRAAMDHDMRAEADRKAGMVILEAAKTYRSGWQWRADLEGFRDWIGYEKTKTAALAAARKAVTAHFYTQAWQ